ncbi:LIM and SH3 domain protein F42H10.3-like isoform X1 [Dinothrombium tinctorium]|uniref:LIM and SH3 domain protein F42H10.3-like isoform X1 n=1 Tax=Dinothrombium tinctorium TaxID=1965070 RepID=A0A3S3SQ76_9ACAR|nr:LIM and SH3 domain protein F42H10.3-like isoform X1 [Dinothrombium tinctorium]RWS17467.1 LIM and SH3 domain protein F42H10.3-like isoform X1 [Dinothrombium tinctorium]
MNKCARCEKTVYPIEEFKCLDKVWHKGCFKCQECGMALNMKTYKGYNKLPYCSAHVPQVRHTAVADTPEARRLAENTRIQSNIKYHEDFEKLKGKVTQVADDPETVRIRNTSKIISNVTYHGEYEKKKQMEEKRSLVADSNGLADNQVADNREDGSKHEYATEQASQQSFLSTDKNRMVLSSSGDQNQNHDTQEQFRMSHFHGSGANKDNNSYSTNMQSNVIYTSDQGSVSNISSRKIGSIADYDPLNDNYGSIASSNFRSNASSFYPGPNAQNVSVTNPQMRPGVNRVYRAMYDYAAQDVDEVSFQDGDLIINCVPIDEGWMTGTIQRTGQTGMLPANYVELYN